MPVGNDIIDLNRVRHRPVTDRFIEKILHPLEIAFLNQSPNPFCFLWMLWTIKEAAYKYNKQRDKNFVFSPRKIYIGSSDFDGGWIKEIRNTDPAIHADFSNTLMHPVNTNLGILYAHSLLTTEYIHTTVVEHESGVCWGIKKISEPEPALQSEEVRHFLLSLFEEQTAYLLFREKIPVVHTAGKKYAASLSHDGHYVSFACENS